MYKLTAILILILQTTSFAQLPALLPNPAEADFESGKSFSLPERITVESTGEELWDEHLNVFSNCLKQLSLDQHQIKWKDRGEAKPILMVTKSNKLASEAYTLEVTADLILIEASSIKGLAHATASLIQLVGENSKAIPSVRIADQPAVPYRNLLIDMGRNPHSVELLKETIDFAWFYKLDSLHLHLTDDQRFAFPSTAFPKLWDGLITLEQFKELEAYAVVRGVTLIPELEVPGHSTKLRNTYPEVFGKSPTDLAVSEEALTGIKTLIDEMLDVFSSSPWMHIGGDEAYGVPEELQRDLINKLHAYLKSKGKQTIVWEGTRPGEGDNRVNKEVIHINWRTINYPADQMLNNGHRVINAAWDPLYIVDHYPRTNFTMTSPQHIFENLKLTRFKHVNPGIPTFAKPIEVDPTDQLIGYCMCWWEGREENFASQVFPRLIPVADVAWNPVEQREFKEFHARCLKTEAVRTAAFNPKQSGAIRSNIALPSDTKNLASRKPVTSSATSGSPFSTERVTDGDKENLGFYLGYPATSQQPIAITIDLQRPEIVGRVTVHAYTISGSFEKYTLQVSRDGKSYVDVGSRLDKPEKPQAMVEHKFEPQELQFIRILSHGNRGYVFDSFSKIVEVEAFAK
jgi:hexosaminidase